MAYIRMGQEGSYVEIPGGSTCYIYDNGSSIDGWSHEEFAALIGSVVDEIDLDGDGYGIDAANVYFKNAFASHFGGWDEDYSGGIAPPERGEIFCQCVDRRIDGIELPAQLQEAVQEWVNEYDAMEECEYCGTEFRPAIKGLSDTYVCNSDECRDKQKANSYDVDVAMIEREDRIFDHLYYDYGWSLKEASHAATNYLMEQSPRDFDK